MGRGEARVAENGVVRVLVKGAVMGAVRGVVKDVAKDVVNGVENAWESVLDNSVKGEGRALPNLHDSSALMSRVS